jgi:hypothetical protein
VIGAEIANWQPWPKTFPSKIAFFGISTGVKGCEESGAEELIKMG